MFSKQLQFSQDNHINLYMGSVIEYPIHWHKSLEIIAVLEGTIKVKDGFESHVVNEGEIIVINTNDLHSITGTDSDNVIIILNIDVARLKLENSLVKDTIIVCDSNTDKYKYANELNRAFTIIMQIQILSYQKDEVAKNTIRKLLNEIISLLIDNFRYLRVLENNFTNIDSSDSNLTTLGGTMDYIYKNYNEKITLKDISDHENISTYYISHLIKKVSGLTFQEYLGMLRAENSEKLLIASNKSITEIAYEAGFSDVKYYNKHFKKWYGRLPGDYRKYYKDYFFSTKKNNNYSELDLESTTQLFSKYLGENWTDMFSSEGPTTIISIDKSKSSNKELNLNFPIFVVDCNDFNSVLVFKNCLSQITNDITIKKIRFEFIIKNDALNQLAQLEMLLSDIPANELNNICELVLRLNIHQISRDDSYALIYNQINNIALNVCSYYNQDFRIEIINQSAAISNKTILADFISHIKTKTQIKDLTIIENSDTDESISNNIDNSNSNINIYDSVDILPYIYKQISLFDSGHMGKTKEYSHKLIDSLNIGKLFNNDSGIISSSGLKKVSYYFYSLMSKMKGQIMDMKDNYILSKDDYSITLLLHNLSQSKSIQPNYSKIKFIIDLKAVSNQIKYNHYTLSREHGCIYKTYINYDCPAFLNNNEMEIFERLSYPKVELGHIESHNKNLVVELLPESVELYIFNLK